MSNFIPAILSPLVILLGLVFSAMQINQGGRVFGGIMFALCALQAWYIADHFGGISGSIGITNPKQIEEATAKRYSSTNLQAPLNSDSIIEQKCAEEWPSDFRMRRHCQEQQNQGISALSKGRPDSVRQEAFIIIRGKCAEEWPRDFRMRAHCEGQQFDGYHSLQAATTSESQRGACAQKWPNDYRMRQHCEGQR